MKYYAINFFKYNFITKALKRLFKRIKLNLYKFIIAAIIFIVVIIFIIVKKIHVIKITLYNIFKLRFSIFIIINEFSLL